MWENTYQIIYDTYIKDGENPRKFVSVEIPMNEGARMGYRVIEFDYGNEDGSGMALMKCTRCHDTDEGRVQGCVQHEHQRRS